MDQEFVDQARRGLELARRRAYSGLGELQRLNRLRLVENRLRSSPERTPSYYGRAIQELMWEVIDGMKPQSPEDLNDPPWRQYILARDYFQRGQGWQTVAQRLGVGRSVHGELKRDVMELIAVELWRREEETRAGVAVKSNLPHSPFRQYVKRHNYDPVAQRRVVSRYDERDDLAEVIIEELGRRTWVMTLDATAGAGKTALAYEVAARCKQRGMFEAVIWASAKKKMLVVRAARFAEVPYLQRVTSYEDILDTIGLVLGSRQIKSAADDAGKLRIVTNLLTARSCLIVIDNLEDLRREDLDRLQAFLQEYPGPSRALLTSRRLYALVGSLVTLPGMSYEEASKFLDLQCEGLGLDPLPQEDRELLHTRTEGNPTAMELVLALSRKTRCSVEEAVNSFVGDQIVIEHMVGAAYESLRTRDKEILHAMPIFMPYSASADAVCAATGLEAHEGRAALGVLHDLKLVQKADNRYALPVLVYEFLSGVPDAPFNSSSLSQHTAKLYVNLVGYYTKRLNELRTMDTKLRFLGEGVEGDEKWNVLAVLQGCRALVEAEVQGVDGATPDEAWQHVIELYGLIGEALGVMWYVEERLRWAEQVIQGCKVLGRTGHQAWVEVFDIGWVHLLQGERERAQEIFERNLAWARDEGCDPVQALALHNLARMAMEAGDLDSASDFFAESLELWQKSGAKYADWVGQSKSALGLVRYQQGRLKEALSLLEESLETRRKMGRMGEVIAGLSETALVNAALNNMDQALRTSGDALELGDDIEAPSSAYAYALKLRGEIEEIRGDMDEAIGYVRKACEIYRALGAKLMLSLAERYLCELEEKVAGERTDHSSVQS